jgi:1-acyl-sn-glycerol-3-phosphate acyltransferase
MIGLILKYFRLIYFPLSIFVTSLLCLPICILRPKNYKNTGFFLKVFSFLSKPMGLNSKVENGDILNASHPSIIIANHQHNLDIWAVSAVFQKRVISLGKKELLYVPVFGLVFWLTGNIIIKRGNKSSAKKSLSRVKNYLNKYKISVTIFPEGTRNPKDELLPFKKGAFLTAIQAELPITIVAISRYVTKIDLSKLNSGCIKLSFLKPIPTKGLTESDLPELMSRCRSLLENEVSRLSI